MHKPPRLVVNLLLALACTVIMFVVLELVLRARWEPAARTLASFAKARTTTAEYDVAIETNRAGFRDVSHPNTGFPRVAVLGDSFVFGSGVAFEDVFTYRLQLLFSHQVVFHNFGVPGSGPFNACYLWRDYAKTIGPRVVVVAVYAGNDASDALRESQEARPRLVTFARARMLWFRLRFWWRNRKHAQLDSPRVMDARKAEGWNAFGTANPATMDALLAAARRRGVPADTVRARIDAIPDSLLQDALAFRSNPFNLAEAVLDPDGLRHNLLLDTPELNRGWEALETALRDLHGEVRAADSRLLLVCIPAAVQVDSTYWWSRHLGVRLDDRVLRRTEFQQRLARFADGEGIALVDLISVMRAHPEKRLYYEQDGHWNAAGHDIAARAIASEIEGMLSPAQR